ncbi:MAG: hypothetical protein FWD34_04715 [Oscillospiraceae bacterium]|nr:hypothetical protein [Oscillospiraceae bacterium]MCL2633799.1 hypothetical protein [Oscillospiraceae bacterium]
MTKRKYEKAYYALFNDVTDTIKEMEQYYEKGGGIPHERVGFFIQKLKITQEYTEGVVTQ